MSGSGVGSASSGPAAAGRWSGLGSTSDQVIREASSFRTRAEQPAYLDCS